jgi:hypothetical protein
LVGMLRSVGVIQYAQSPILADQFLS